MSVTTEAFARVKIDVLELTSGQTTGNCFGKYPPSIRIAASVMANRSKKAPRLGLARDHRSCFQDGSKAYCHRADAVNVTL